MSLQRSPANPIIERAKIFPIPPSVIDPSAVFNPGAIRHAGNTYLLLRVQTRGRETVLLTALSANGIAFNLSDRLVTLQGIERVQETVYHVYDPRLTRIDDVIYVMVAMDMDDGCRLGLARTTDLEEFEFMGITSGNDVRNGVLFPERRADGRYLRLERPNRIQLPGGPTTGNEIILSSSSDLLAWEPEAVVASGRPHYWDELIGPGPPPVKTRQGWLLIYHGVATHFGSANIYQAGVMLLDLEDPARVVARSGRNILEPREPYECVGQVPNVVFPTGLVVEQVDEAGFAPPESPAHIYYGAADTTVALATGRVSDLLAACDD